MGAGSRMQPAGNGGAEMLQSLRLRSNSCCLCSRGGIQRSPMDPMLGVVPTPVHTGGALVHLDPSFRKSDTLPSLHFKEKTATARRPPSSGRSNSWARSMYPVGRDGPLVGVVMSCAADDLGQDAGVHDGALAEAKEAQCPSSNPRARHRRRRADRPSRGLNVLTGRQAGKSIVIDALTQRGGRSALVVEMFQTPGSRPSFAERRGVGGTQRRRSTV